MHHRASLSELTGKCPAKAMAELMRQGKFTIIKDLAVIRPGTVLPEGAIVPSMTVWEGNPGTWD